MLEAVLADLWDEPSSPGLKTIEMSYRHFFSDFLVTFIAFFSNADLLIPFCLDWYSTL